jgi:DNA invertase Pin-like site-specific DNA recombinase
MNVAIYARVSTHDKDQNPETQLRPLRQHLAGLRGVSVLGEFIDKAGGMTCGAGASGADFSISH